MLRLDDLPAELIGAILEFVANPSLDGERAVKADLRALRQVSRCFHDHASPFLFRRITLHFKDATRKSSPDCLRCQGIVEALAAGTNRVIRYIQRLEFSATTIFTAQGAYPATEALKSFLVKNAFAAISALRNLRTVAWFFNATVEPEELATDIVRAVATLPFLQEFKHTSLAVGPPSLITLRPTSHLPLTTLDIVWNWELGLCTDHLASLLAHCPHLTALSVEVPFPREDGIRLGEMLAPVSANSQWRLPLKKLELKGVSISAVEFESHIHHFKDLESIGIMRNMSPTGSTALGQICGILKENAIFLKGIRTDHPDDPALLDYIASYSGLEELLFEPSPSMDRMIERSSRFYTQLLRQHRRTLRSLTFTFQNLNQISQYDTPFDPLEEVAACSQLQMLNVRCLVIDFRSGPSCFNSWLDVCSRLPQFTDLKIWPFISPTMDTALARYRETHGRHFLVWSK